MPAHASPQVVNFNNAYHRNAWTAGTDIISVPGPDIFDVAYDLSKFRAAGRKGSDCKSRVKKTLVESTNLSVNHFTYERL